MYVHTHTHTLTGEIKEQKNKLLKFQEDLQKHKDEAQDALEYYRKLSVETVVKYTKISGPLSKEHRTEAENVTFRELQSDYSGFVSADYMMGKNLPFWGESPQPAKTYYQMQLVHDVFGIIDHSKKGTDGNFVYICDELAVDLKLLITPFLFFNTSLTHMSMPG